MENENFVYFGNEVKFPIYLNSNLTDFPFFVKFQIFKILLIFRFIKNMYFFVFSCRRILILIIIMLLLFQIIPKFFIYFHFSFLFIEFIKLLGNLIILSGKTLHFT